MAEPANAADGLIARLFAPLDVNYYAEQYANTLGINVIWVDDYDEIPKLFQSFRQGILPKDWAFDYPPAG